MSAPAVPVGVPAAGDRLADVDLLRGLVMLLMVVDHAREYSAGTGQVADPMAVATIPPLLYVLRWISHLCAPVFVLLAGVSVRLQSARMAPAALARQTALRGLLLVALEFTVIAFGWTFWAGWPRVWAQVIWGIGLSLLVLAGLIRLRVPDRVVLALGLLLVAGHNLLDGVRVEGMGAGRYLWAVLHQREVLPLWPGLEVRTSYPVLPMLGLAAIGWVAGRWVRAGVTDRQWLGAGAVLLASFGVLRAVNVYGDLHPWVPQATAWRTVASFLNVTKYPMSLDFVLVTLGVALLTVPLLRRLRGAAAAAVTTFGRVPMFFYITHIYLLHALALLWALAAGFPLASIRVQERIGGIPEGFGFPLWMTLPFTAVTILLLLPACRWYEGHRRRRTWWWTRWL